MEADLTFMTGHVRARRASFNLFSTKIHVLLSSEALWIAHRSELTRIPLDAITRPLAPTLQQEAPPDAPRPEGGDSPGLRFPQRRECIRGVAACVV